MEVKRICENTADMGMWELAHNFAFIKNHEAWYRDFDREISALDLMREIIMKHGDPDVVSGMTDDELSEMLADDLQYGTNELDGVFAILYMALWGTAEVREWLKAYETNALPTTMRQDVLQQAVHTWGKEAQVDMAIEEMSELTKALLKERRAANYAGQPEIEMARHGVYEEMADVIIMLTQLLVIYGDRALFQKAINEKVERLSHRLMLAERAGNANVPQETQQDTPQEETENAKD